MIITTEIDYFDDDVLCRGFVAYDDTVTQRMPCVLIAHDWSGRSEAFCDKAIQLASMGYVGFAIDMYGYAQTSADNEIRRQLMTPLVEDRTKLSMRISAALHAANNLSFVDDKRIAAIGYCFGGLCVLDLARSGADVRGVVSFHGILSAPVQVEAKLIKSHVLVLHGYNDRLATPDQVLLFADEMTQRNVEWQIHMYGNTEHAFTNPMANDAELGLHYNQLADQRSWHSAEYFLQELL